MWRGLTCQERRRIPNENESEMEVAFIALGSVAGARSKGWLSVVESFMSRLVSLQRIRMSSLC